MFCNYLVTGDGKESKESKVTCIFLNGRRPGKQCAAERVRKYSGGEIWRRGEEF